jgi:hypothetical protein
MRTTDTCTLMPEDGDRSHPTKTVLSAANNFKSVNSCCCHEQLHRVVSCNCSSVRTRTYVHSNNTQTAGQLDSIARAILALHSTQSWPTVQVKTSETSAFRPFVATKGALKTLRVQQQQLQHTRTNETMHRMATSQVSAIYYLKCTWSIRYSCQILIKPVFFPKDFRRALNYHTAAELFHADSHWQFTSL